MRLFFKISSMKNLEYDLDKTIIKIAEKIKRLRKEKGFTSYESFAFEHEINRVQYFRIEKGQNITLKTLIKVLQIHNLTLKEFFDDF